MAQPVRKSATYEDILALPENVIGEILGGELHVQPRPASPHQRAATVLTSDLGGPFDRGKGGPGGWVILYEVELHLGPDVLVPDLSGWRRERMPVMPDVPYMTLAPDWACEVLSPSTTRVDRVKKLPIFARERVRHVWLVDPAEHVLEVFRLDGETYRVIATFGGDDPVRPEPFDAVPLDLAAVWSR